MPSKSFKSHRVSERLDSTHLLEIVRRRSAVFLAALTFTVVSVFIPTLFSVSLYRADAKILIEGEVASFNKLGDIGTVDNFNLYENYIKTQLEIIKSDGVAGSVFRELGLEKSPRYFDEGRPGRGFAKFVKDLELRRVQGTRLLVVSVYNPDPILAANVSNRLVETYLQDNLRRRASLMIRDQKMADLHADYQRLRARLDAIPDKNNPQNLEGIRLKTEIEALLLKIKKEREGDAGAAAISGEAGGAPDLESALERLREESVLTGAKTNNITIVDRAAVPIKPAKPKKLLYLAASVFLGVFLGYLAAILADRLDDRIKDEEELRRLMPEVPYIGSIPQAANSGSRTGASGAAPKAPEKMFVMDSQSAISEAYRLLRTRFLWSASSAEGKFKDFAMVSSVPGEGKTTLACNLSAALGELNLKVLLVDTDFRKGRLHEIFGIPNDPGLGQYLVEGVPFDKIVRKTSVPGLSIVSRGTSVIEGSQLLNSPKMNDFILEARKHYDWVVYDTPPLAIIADAGIFVSRLGSAVFVVRTDFTKIDILTRACAILGDSGARVAGVVLNSTSAAYDKSYLQYYRAYRVG